MQKKYASYRGIHKLDSCRVTRDGTLKIYDRVTVLDTCLREQEAIGGKLLTVPFARGGSSSALLVQLPKQIAMAVVMQPGKLK